MAVALLVNVGIAPVWGRVVVKLDSTAVVHSSSPAVAKQALAFVPLHKLLQFWSVQHSAAAEAVLHSRASSLNARLWHCMRPPVSHHNHGQPAASCSSHCHRPLLSSYCTELTPCGCGNSQHYMHISKSTHSTCTSPSQLMAHAQNAHFQVNNGSLLPQATLQAHLTPSCICPYEPVYAPTSGTARARCGAITGA